MIKIKNKKLCRFFSVTVHRTVASNLITKFFIQYFTTMTNGFLQTFGKVK